LFFHSLSPIWKLLPTRQHYPVARSRSDVHCGQRIAPIGISIKQNGHSLVVGSDAGSSSALWILFTLRMRRKTANATIKKVMIVLIKSP
jgi:hypothetical protein